MTDWSFYIDVDNDGLMETSDIVYRVKWQGSNQNTSRELWSYTPSITGGDVLVSPTTGFADGYDMPGTISNRQLLSAITGGSGTGLMMETFLPWSTLCGIGCSPQSVRFHISSSNGSNLPNNIVDNMDGPCGSGGAIVILDLNVDKVASFSETVGGGPNFTYHADRYQRTGWKCYWRQHHRCIAPGVSYVSDNSASTGTTFTDTGDAGSDPDLWTISNLNDGQSISLIITVSPDVVGSNTVVSNTASQLTLN